MAKVCVPLNVLGVYVETNHQFLVVFAFLFLITINFYCDFLMNQIAFDGHLSHSHTDARNVIVMLSFEREVGFSSERTFFLFFSRVSPSHEPENTVYSCYFSFSNFNSCSKINSILLQAAYKMKPCNSKITKILHTPLE